MKTTPDIYVMPYISGSFLLECNNKDGRGGVYICFVSVYILWILEDSSLSIYIEDGEERWEEIK